MMWDGKEKKLAFDLDIALSLLGAARDRHASGNSKKVRTARSFLGDYYEALTTQLCSY